MLHRRIWSALVGAFVVGALVTACGGGDNVEVVQPGSGTGEQGQSCGSNADCVSGLVCFSNICVEEGDQPSIQLGEIGESCQSRSDCQQGLQCISNLCTDEPPPEDALGKRGESCETRSDCEAGLTCIENTCVIDDFGLEKTDKVCVSVACSEPADCLTQYTTEQCDTYETDCMADPATETSLQSCDLRRLYCIAANWDCTSAGACAFTGSCTYQYSVSYDCPTSVAGNVCDTDTDSCVECVEAIDCGVNQDCVENKCVTTCQVKEDCPFFNTCDEGACIETGCESDRECVAWTYNALATCDADSGECVEPCQTDAECDSAFNYSFRACVEGTCEDVGCDTDEECRIRGGSSLTKWSCREPE
jgi:hypothetical protein